MAEAYGDNSNISQAEQLAIDQTRTLSTPVTKTIDGNPMFDHISIGASDLARSGKFYDSVLATLGYARRHSDDASLGYGGERIEFWVVAAERPVAADPKSGLHFCFTAPTRASVDAFHASALAAGGEDNGTPGLRKDYGPNYYAAFAIDPDGYRIEAHCSGKV